MFAPFPHGYTVSRGVPDNCTFEIALSQAIMLTLLFVCAFFSASYASFLTRQSSQATNVCLTLAYSFSQRVHSIPLGPIIQYLAWVFIIWFPSGGLPRVINCAFDQSFHAKSENACLLLVYSFSPRVQSIPRGPLISARNDIKCVARDNVKKVCRLCYYFSANKRLLCSVRSTLSF